jgi:membrane protein YqaA with SNARE-associated domain
MDRGGGIGRPQVFGAGVSLGMFAGILIGSLVTWWLGEAALGLLQRMLQRMFGRRRDRIHFELLLQ